MNNRNQPKRKIQMKNRRHFSENENENENNFEKFSFDCLENRKFKPLPNQIGNIEDMYNSFEKFHFYINSSRPGTGKTPVTNFISIIKNLPIFLVSPANLIPMWKNFCNEMENPMAFCTSYESLYQDSINNPKSKFLITKYDSEKKKYKFEATKLFDDLINSGVLIVFEEASRIKNEFSVQRNACVALVKRLFYFFNKNGAENFRSRVLLLSGTPGTEIKHIKTTMKTVCLLGEGRIFEFKKNYINYGSIRPLYNICYSIDPEKTKEIINHINEDKSKDNITKIIVSLFVKILKKHVSGNISPPDLSHINIDIKNKFYNLSDFDLQQMEKSMYKYIKKIINIDEEFDLSDFDIDSVDIRPNKGNAINNRIKCDKMKVPIVVREVKRILGKKKHKNTNIFIACEYVNGVLDVLVEELKEFNPFVLKGNVPMEEREIIKNKFNEDNNECRLLIASNVITYGHSFHPVHPNRPLYMFIFPTFSAEKEIQRIYRGVRQGIKSNCKIRFVYVANLEIELQLISSLIRQTSSIKKYLDESNIEGALFPDTFDCVNERVGDEEKEIWKMNPRNYNDDNYELY